MFMDIHEVSLQNISFLNLELYPNPANDAVTIFTGIREPQVLEVFDLLGRSVIHAMTFTEPTHQIDIESLDPGLYLVRISTGKGEFGAARLVVER